MSDLTEDKTDKLFQAGAERFDFTYNSEAWNQMEGLLDAEQKRRRFLFMSLFGTVGLSLAIVLYALFGAQTTRSDSSLSQTPQVTDSRLSSFDTEESTSFSDVENSSILKTADQNDSAKDLGVNSGDVIVSGEIASQIIPSSKDPISSGLVSATGTTKVPLNNQSNNFLDRNESSPAIEGGELIERMEGKLEENSSFEHKTVISKGPSSKKTVEGKLNGLELPVINTSGVKNPQDKRQLSTLGTNSLLPVYSDFATVKRLSIESSDVVQVSGAESVLSRFSVRVHGGVLYGVTDQMGVGMARSRYGVGLGYSTSDNWSIGTGVSVNNLCYITNGSGYKTKQDSWFGGASPSKIEALCKVLEIPLEATYHWNGSRRTGLYLRGGVLNYIMLKEDYTYTYDEDNLPAGVEIAALKTGWSEVNENRHFLGMAQLALGYQLALSERNQLQVEGFIHAPMSGIGHGNVQVWSFGLNTAINLNIK